MNFKSKKTSLLILGVTSLVVSRGLFTLFDDPEGPNLLIVTVLAGIVYVVSFILSTYIVNPGRTDFMKLVVVISIQVLLVTSLYFFLG